MPDYDTTDPTPATVQVGPFNVTDSGVYYREPNAAGAGHWICSRLDVLAFARNPQGEDWGLLVHFRDPDGQDHKPILPMETLAVALSKENLARQLQADSARGEPEGLQRDPLPRRRRTVLCAGAHPGRPWTVTYRQNMRRQTARTCLGRLVRLRMLA